jgi:predicted RNase H-like HicB family nuclease
MHTLDGGNKVEPLTVHVIFYHEESHYVAHCLEFDLVAQGATTSEAFRNLLDAIELQATYAQETGDWGNLIQPAPLEYWRMLVTAEPYTPQPDGWALPTILAHTDCSLVHA